MDAISVRCKSCQRMMKFPAEKAGKRIKCPKCGTVAPIEPADDGDEAAALLLAEDPKPQVKKKVVAAVKEEESDTLELVDEPKPALKKKKKKGGGQAAEVESLQLADDPPVEETATAALPPPPSFDSPPPAGESASAPKPKSEFDDDGPSSYGVFVDPELQERQKELQAEEAAKAKQKKVKKKLPKVLRKLKAIEEAESWAKVRVGLLCFMVGACVWLFCHLLQGAYLLAGSVELPEYAVLMNETLGMRASEGLPKVNQGWDVDDFDIYMGMIAGRDFAGFAKVCITLAALCYFLQAGMFVLGYLFCLPVPRRFGMFGQVLLMLILAVINGLLVLGFKLLPILGAYNYIMIPYVVPEIAMTEYNMERMVPINIMWSGAPVFENVCNVFFKFMLYLEPAITCVFVWSIGCVVKDKEVQESGKGLTQMCLGTMFILLTFHLLSICGATPVMVLLLRVVYALWYVFVILFLLKYALFMMKVRAVLDEKIHPKNEQVVEEEEEEEEED